MSGYGNKFKLFGFIGILLMLTAVFSGCSQGNEPEVSPGDSSSGKDTAKTDDMGSGEALGGATTVNEKPKEASLDLIGTWQCKIEYQGQVSGAAPMTFEKSRIIMGGNSFDYSVINSKIIRMQSETGMDDYDFVLMGDKLTMTYSDGSKFLCDRGDSLAGGVGTGGTTGGTVPSGNEGLLQGTYCTWGGSSDSYSSYSRSAWASFDGQGKFTYGSESSFSSGAGQAYGGSGTEGGTYRISGDNIILTFSDGSSDGATVYNRGSGGVITEFYYGSDLYAPSLCE